LAAGLAEIGGGYFVWLWLRGSIPMWIGVLGGFCMGSFPPCKASRTLAVYMPPTAGSLLFWRPSEDGSWTGKRLIFTAGSGWPFAWREFPSCCGVRGLDPKGTIRISKQVYFA